jgi:hypothetical protein
MVIKKKEELDPEEVYEEGRAEGIEEARKMSRDEAAKAAIKPLLSPNDEELPHLSFMPARQVNAWAVASVRDAMMRADYVPGDAMKIFKKNVLTYRRSIGWKTFDAGRDLAEAQIQTPREETENVDMKNW